MGSADIIYIILIFIEFNIFMSKEKDQNDKFLCYGQGILIQGYDKGSEGVLTAKGFADIRALFETYDDILYFKNYRNSIFQILPASSFDIHDELKHISDNNLTTTQSNLEVLKAKQESEKKQFELTIESKDKQIVCFGDQIVFKHIDSGTFLSGTISPSNGSSGAFLVEVTNSLKSNLIFKLMPYRSFESQSNPIPLESPIIIQNIHNKGSLTFERVGKNQKKDKNLYWNKSPIKSDQSYRIPIKTESTSSEIYDCVTHFVDLSAEDREYKMPWKFQLHFSDVNNDNLIQHDIVYFQHTQNNGVLAAIGEEQIALKQLKDQKTSELRFFDCLWEIQEHKPAGKNFYILRHLMSGMTLGVDIVNSTQRKLRPKLVDISDGKGDGSIDNLGTIQLSLAKKEGGAINSKSLINICSEDMVLDIKRQKSSKRDLQNQMIDGEANKASKKDDKTIYDTVDTTKMNQLMNNEFNFEIKKLEFTLDVSKHCFVIQEIDDELKSEVLFALSFHSRLIRLRQDLKWGAKQSEQKVDYLRLMQITNKVKQIKYFLKNTTIDDPNKDFKRPVQKKQIICYHLGISELLFEVLFFMKKNLNGQVCNDGKLEVTSEKIFENQPNQKEKFMELYYTIYEVIFELIRDNYQFKVHVSKWFAFIAEDVIVYGNQYILKTLLELLHKNAFFINNFVTEQLVSFLVDVMPKQEKLYDQSMRVEFHEKKFIEIFRAFCICGKEVYSENQVLILDKFIKVLPDPKYEIYDIKITKKKNQKGDYEIVCEAAVDKQTKKPRRFIDYHKICEDQYPSAWAYLIAFLNLIADMVQGRNKTVEGYVETLLSAETLSDLMSQELFEVEVPIIRIMHYLYAESEKFYPIDRTTRVIPWDKLNEQTKLNSTKSIIDPQIALGSVMSILKDKLQSYKTIRVEDIALNEKLYVVLDFVKQTFQLGFWKNKQEVLQIFHCIKTLITPAQDINYDEIREQSQKKEVVLMISCKEKCLQILDYIIDLDIDFNCTEFSKCFKEFSIPTKKIEVEVSNFLEVSEECHFAVDFYNSYKDKTKSVINMVSIDICQKMIELSKHNHPRLTSYSLRILERILDIDNKVANNFSNLIFVCEEDRNKLYDHICKKRDKFFTLEYQNTTKVNYNNQKSHYFMMYKDDSDAGIMQDLYMIGQLVKNQNSLGRINDIKSLDASRTFRELATQKLINFTSQRRSSNIMKQQVVDASNIHQKVLGYILNCRQIPEEQLARKLLHLAYKFLVSIIENNQSLKLTLLQYIQKIMHHIKKNLGCIDFLKEMYDNNKNMLYNQYEILNLIKLICDTLQEQELTFSYYKSKLLDFFRYLIYCNGRALKYNQIQILKIMQDDQYQNILYHIEKSRIHDLVTRFEEVNYPENYDPEIVKPIKMEPELVYITTLFQIMVSLIDGKCEVNMGKLVKKFPFETLVEWIEVSKKCWPLKRNIRAFLNRLYYFQPEIQSYMGTIIKKEILNVIEDLNYFIEIKCKSTSDFEARTFENPVRFSYIQSYLYLNLEENLFTLHQLVKKHEILQELKNYLHSKNIKGMEGPYNFLRICERLGWIRNYFSSHKNIFTTSFIKHLLKHLRDIIKQFDDNVYAEGMFFVGQRMPSKTDKDRQRQVVIKRILQGEIQQFYVQASKQVENNTPLVYLLPAKPPAGSPDDKNPNKEKLIRKLREILTKTTREFKNKDDQIRYNQEKIISALQLSIEVKEEFVKSYNSRLNEISSGETVMLDYVSSIIAINSEDPNAFDPELKIFFLKMIIGQIEQGNKTQMPQKKPIDEWEPEDWETYKPEINKLQIKLKKCNLQGFIAELLKQKIEEQIPLANQILLCGISFLLGGNQVTQKTLIEQILKDRDNRVFRNLANLINKLGKLILKNIDESNMKPTDSDDFEITLIDNYDFYEYDERYCLRKNVIQPRTTNQVIEHREYIVTYRRAFRFLQLLCESNNITNKNLIREQPDKLVSVDFIAVATNELRNLFLVMCKSIVDVPLFLLQFLLEVTQIPVKQNQEALTNSSFFEDVCQMNNEFAKPGKLEMRNFDKGTNPLEQVLGKTISIVLSNFQGNDEKTFKTIDQKLQPKFLVNILISKLQAMEVKNKKDMLNYVKSSLQEIDENGHQIISPHYQDEMIGIFDILVIFIKLNDKLGTESRLYQNYNKFKNSTPEYKEIFQYLENCLINIEVNDPSGKKQTIYFPKQPVHYSLSDTTRDYIMKIVQRSSHRQKIVSLFGYVISLKDNLEYSYKMKKIEEIEEKDLSKNYKIAASMSIFICIYLMIFYHVIIEFGESEVGANRIIQSGCFFFSLIQLSFSIIYLMYWVKLRVWKQPESIPNNIDQLSGIQNTIQKQHEEKSLVSKYLSPIFDLIQNNFPYYDNGEFYRILLFVMFSFLGTFYDPSFFFIHIIDIFCQAEMLANIFQAIALNINKLVLISLLGAVFVGIFCTITFSNYMKSLYEEETGETCHDMLGCILQLYISGSIDSMDEFEYTRFFYNLIYGVFFGILFENIVSSIMLNSFASLRSQNEELDADKSDYCYICNIKRQKLQKMGVNFRAHTRKKHFLWNYIFYLITLRNKSPTDYTGLQYEINKQYNKSDEDMIINWIPDADADEIKTDYIAQIKKLISITEDFDSNISEKDKELLTKIQDFNKNVNALKA